MKPFSPPIFDIETPSNATVKAEKMRPIILDQYAVLANAAAVKQGRGISSILPTSPDKSQARRDLASVYLRDSRYGELSPRSRADAALDAVYLYALAALGAQADEYEHPSAKALTAAAKQLGWPAGEMASAVRYLKRRYAPARPLYCLSSKCDALISIAEKLRGEVE